MPISSSKVPLNKQKFRPPPKSLEEILWEEQQRRQDRNLETRFKNEHEGKDKGDSDFNEFSTKDNIKQSGEKAKSYEYDQSEVKHNGTLFSERNKHPNGAIIRRESHLKDIKLHKKTAVIAPIKDEDLSTKSKDNRNNQLNDDALKMTKNANNIKRVPYKSYDKVENSCCRSCLRRSCYFCMYPMSKSRCRWAAVLLGITLGALITGLVLGLVLGNQLKEAEQELQENAGCFQSPCPYASTTCSYQGDSQLNCVCNGGTGNPTSTSNVTADGYNCTLFNITELTTGAPATTLP